MRREVVSQLVRAHILHEHALVLLCHDLRGTRFFEHADIGFPLNDRRLKILHGHVLARLVRFGPERVLVHRTKGVPFVCQDAPCIQCARCASVADDFPGSALGVGPQEDLQLGLPFSNVSEAEFDSPCCLVQRCDKSPSECFDLLEQLAPAVVRRVVPVKESGEAFRPLQPTAARVEFLRFLNIFAADGSQRCERRSGP